VAHPPLTYLLDDSGRIAFVTLSGGEALQELSRRLDGEADAAGLD
jgi:hypothetical protein